MDQTSTTTSAILLDRVSDWLMQTALKGADLKSVVNGFCERLAAAGVPLVRIHLTFSMLHPLYRAMGFTWRRGTGITAEGYRHVSSEAVSERFLKSPYYHLLNNKLDYLRRRIIPGETPEFPILDDLQKEGMTDYLAFAAGFGEDSNSGHDGFMGDRSRGRLYRWRHLGLAAHPEQSRVGITHGGSRPAGREHVDDLPWRWCRNESAERPDQAR